MLRFEAATSEEWEMASLRGVVPLRVERMGPGFRGALIRQEFDGGLAIVHARARAHELARTRDLIAASADSGVLIELNVRGGSRVEQHRRSAAIAPGQGTMYDTRSPYRLSFPSDIETLLVQVPRERLALTNRTLAHSMARGLDKSMPEWALLFGYAHVAWSVLANSTPRTSTLIADTLGELAAAVVEGVAGRSRPRPLVAALPELRRTIERHLADPRLSPSTLAKEHEISVRSVHAAFELIGTTPARYIRERRIERARMLLTSTDLRIIDVSTSCGFAEASTFVRAFRRITGMAPSDYRSANRPD